MITFFVCFGLAFALFVINLSLKTVLLSFKVTLKGIELAAKTAAKAGKVVVNQAKSVSADVGIPIGNAQPSALSNAIGKTKAKAQSAINTVQTGVRTVQKTGKAAVNTGKTAVKATKTTAKIAVKAGKMSIKAIKLTIQALQWIINLIYTAITALISLGWIGLIILIVIILFLVAAIAGSLLALNTGMDGGLTGVFGSGGPGFSGGLGTGFFQTGQPGVGGGGAFTGGGTVTPGQPGTVVTPGDTTALYNACQTMANWYIAHVPTYQQRTDGSASGNVGWYTCDIMPFGSMQVGDECGRFAAAYGSYASGKKIVNEGAIRTIYKGSNAWTNAGWKYYTMDEIGGVNGLQPGDVMLASNVADPCSKGGHAEVYLGPNKTFGWGRIQTKFPSNTSTLTNWTCSHGNIYVQAGANGHRYGRIFRYAGG